MGLRIHILCSDGSPLGVTSKTIWGDEWRVGVGGAELALLTMCEEWTKAGHEVVLYNDPHEAGVSSFEQLPVAAFSPTDKKRDVLIIFRSPNPSAVVADGLKVWWSTDQHTVGSFSNFAPLVDKIVCISPFHANYFRSQYGIHNAISIDLPVRFDDFKDIDEERVDNRCIFTSVPDRGLNLLSNMWGTIKKHVPDASLVITSDYRLWGVATARNEKYRVKWIRKEDVTFLGAVQRGKMLKEVAQAELFTYPSTYEELFCISCAEAESLGAFPITSETGALGSTNIGEIVHGNPHEAPFKQEFVERVVYYLKNKDKLSEKRKIAMEEARKRFSPETILEQWDNKVFNE